MVQSKHMVYYDPRKPKPWPVRLLNKLGVTDDAKATNIALGVAFVLIIITIILYSNILGHGASQDPDFERELLLMEEK